MGPAAPLKGVGKNTRSVLEGTSPSHVHCRTVREPGQLSAQQSTHGGWGGHALALEHRPEEREPVTHTSRVSQAEETVP